MVRAGLSKHRSRAGVVKSASALGLSLMVSHNEDSTAIITAHPSKAAILASCTAVPVAGEVQSPGGNGSSTASSRDTSPCRDLSPLVTNLKPPIIIRRGPRGFGFTVHTIRVYYGDTDFYTMHHLVMAVDDGSPAFEAGLRPADLITHVNGEPVQGLYHTQVLQLLLSGAEHVTLRATPLEHTSIQSGGRKRELWQSKMAKKAGNARQRKDKRKDNDKKRKTSLFRRISSKRASAEMQQLAAVQSPTMVTPSRSFQGFARSESLNSTAQNQRMSLSPLDTFTAAHQSASNSSQSSSPSSSAPNTPTGSSATPLYPRPSTLHGLKHKLHTPTSSKSLHANSQNSGPNRRKSVGHIPLSPLARTPSPSPLPASPTRSPSPLAFPTGHMTGASNTTQAYVPGTSPNTTPIPTGTVAKKSFARPKSAEPSSPLLRRALSPDRLHPRSAEINKCVLSPLCCNAPIKTNQRPASGVWRPSSATTVVAATSIVATITEKHELETEPAAPPPSPQTVGGGSMQQPLSLSLTQPGELLPRIAEEKDSPTSSTDDKLESRSPITDKSLDSIDSQIAVTDVYEPIAPFARTGSMKKVEIKKPEPKVAVPAPNQTAAKKRSESVEREKKAAAIVETKRTESTERSKSESAKIVEKSAVEESAKPLISVKEQVQKLNVKSKGKTQKLETKGGKSNQAGMI